MPSDKVNVWCEPHALREIGELLPVKTTKTAIIEAALRHFAAHLRSKQEGRL